MLNATPQPPRLTRIKVEGLRSLASVELCDLGPLSLFIGPNGTGKSNLLLALRLMHEGQTGAIGTTVGLAGGAEVLLHGGGAVTTQINIELDFTDTGGRQVGYRCTLTPSADDRLLFTDEQAGLRASPEGPWTFDETVSTGGFRSGLAGNHSPIAGAVSECLIGLAVYHFDASARLRINSRAAESVALLPSGENLAAMLARLQSAPSDRDLKAAFLRIQGHARRVIPSLASLDTVAMGNGHIRLSWLDHQGRRYGPEHLSDGSLRALALITVLNLPEAQRPATLAIDEPELGLHPNAQRLLASLMALAAASRQVLATTQSVALLDAWPADSVWLTDIQNGATRFRRLDPDAAVPSLDA